MIRRTSKVLVARRFVLAVMMGTVAMSAGATSAPGSKEPPEATRTKAARIEWKAWEPDAFRRARTLDRPILLSVVARWNRACREMERTWSDPKIVAMINANYVPIMVNADERPDIKERYAGAGWPSNTLLVADGSPFFSEAREVKEPPVRVTFAFQPPDKLMAILQAAIVHYKTKKGTLKKTIEEGLRREEEANVEPGQIDPAVPRKIVASLRSNFDSLNGGWTKAPKFPLPGPIEACLHAYAQDGDAAALEIGEKALHGITDGGLFDRVDGGIYRLAMGEDWTRPEFEKLLDRNVAVLDQLLSAFVMTQNQFYAEKAGGISRFLDGVLRRQGGGYYAAQSADPDSADGGAYFRATAAERRKLKAPPVENLVLVGWSAKAAVAQLRAAAVLKRPDLAGPAVETLKYLLGEAFTSGRGVIHALATEAPVLSAYLEDQVLFAEAMLDAYAMTGDGTYRDAAVDVARFSLLNLRDTRTRLFSDVIPEPAGPVLMRKPLRSFEVNCRMARVMARLYYMNTEQKALQFAASGILSVLAPVSETKGPNAAYYALASVEFQDGPTWAWAIGRPSEPGFVELLAQVQRLPVLWKLVVRLDPVEDAETLSRMGFSSRRVPVLYLSRGTHTTAPAFSSQDVLKLYKSLAEESTKEGKPTAKPAKGEAG